MYLYGYLPYRQSNEKKVKVKYSHQRIKQILHEDYHYDLIPISVGYKGNRRRGYVQKYDVRSLDTGELIVSHATLNAIRIILQQEGYPLHAPEQPNQGAVDFLAYVESTKQHNR